VNHLLFPHNKHLNNYLPILILILSVLVFHPAACILPAFFRFKTPFFAPNGRNGILTISNWSEPQELTKRTFLLHSQSAKKFQKSNKIISLSLFRMSRNCASNIDDEKIEIKFKVKSTTTSNDFSICLFRFIIVTKKNRWWVNAFENV
jgi:hypothetical protein